VLSGARARRVSRGLAALICAACAACTAPNPWFVPPTSGRDDGRAAVDLAGPADRSPADAACPDCADGAPDGPAPVTSLYPFESAVQGWKDQHYDFFGKPAARVTRSTAHAYDGVSALEIALVTSGTYHTPEIGVTSADFVARIGPGTVITYHVWLPPGGQLEGVQPYVNYYRAGSAAPVWGGIDPILFASNLTAGGWATVTHRVPMDVDARGVVEVGMEWRTNGPQSVTVYLDAVTW
jgi:hypothetical protein